MSLEYFNRAMESGYGKYTQLAHHFTEMLTVAKSLPDDVNVIVTLHDRLENTDGMSPVRKIKTVGQMVDQHFEPAALFTVLLFTKVLTSKEGRSYKFVTNSVNEDSAKSPMGMFEELYIDNDMQKVLEAIKEYNN